MAPRTKETKADTSNQQGTGQAEGSTSSGTDAVNDEAARAAAEAQARAEAEARAQADAEAQAQLLAQEQAQANSGPAYVQVQFGQDLAENGFAEHELSQLGFPREVVISNRMPRRISLPDLQGLSLAHVAAEEPQRVGKAVFKDAAHLARFVADMRAICELNDYAVGVLVETRK